jgi:hypothetical protein
VNRSCPNDDQLRQLIAAAGDPAAVDQLAAHVESCPVCQQRLEALGRQSPAPLLPVDKATALADPLLPFIESQGSTLQGTSTGETANLAPLVCTAGALHDLACDCCSQAPAFQRRKANAARIEQLATAMNWRILRGCGDLASGVLLLQSHSAPICQLSATDHQALWDRQGITVTAYPDGLLRIAMPDRDISIREWAAITRPLREAWRSLPRGATAIA